MYKGSHRVNQRPPGTNPAGGKRGTWTRDHQNSSPANLSEVNRSTAVKGRNSKILSLQSGSSWRVGKVATPFPQYDTSLPQGILFLIMVVLSLQNPKDSIQLAAQ